MHLKMLSGKRPLTHEIEHHLMVEGNYHFYANFPFVLSICFDFLCGNGILQDVYINFALNNFQNLYFLKVSMSKIWLKMICAPFE